MDQPTFLNRIGMLLRTIVGIVAWIVALFSALLREQLSKPDDASI